MKLYSTILQIIVAPNTLAICRKQKATQASAAEDVQKSSLQSMKERFLQETHRSDHEKSGTVITREIGQYVQRVVME